MVAYRRVCDSRTCRLTAKNRDQLRNPTLGNRVWAAFTLMIDEYETATFCRVLLIIVLVMANFYSAGPQASHQLNSALLYMSSADSSPRADESVRAAQTSPAARQLIYSSASLIICSTFVVLFATRQGHLEVTRGSCMPAFYGTASDMANYSKVRTASLAQRQRRGLLQTSKM